MSKPERVRLIVTQHTSGRPVADMTREVDLEDAGALEEILRDAVEADRWDLRRLPEFEMDVRDPVTNRLITTVRTGPED